MKRKLKHKWSTILPISTKIVHVFILFIVLNKEYPNN